MRVAYLLRYYPTLTESFVTAEIGALVDRGLDVRVISLGDRADGALAEELPAAPHQRLPRASFWDRRGPQTAGERFLAAAQRPKDMRRLRALWPLLAAVDRVHVHFAGEAAELAHAAALDGGPPYSVTVHAVDLYKPRPFAGAVLAGAAQVFAVSEHTAALTARLAGRPVRCLRCGPDLRRRPALPLPDGPLRALFVGRDVPKKGLDTLLAAWGALPADARLTVVSDRRGPMPPGVEATGLLGPTALRQRLAAANLVVLPCEVAPDGDQDGVPLVLMEGMAAGRPVVSTPVSGIPELVDAAVGWLVPPADPGALAAVLGGADAAARAARGAGGRARLQERGFTLDDQVEGLLTAWAGGWSSQDLYRQPAPRVAR